MQNWLTNNIKNIYNNIEIKVDIVFNSKIEANGQAIILLIWIAILC